MTTFKVAIVIKYVRVGLLMLIISMFQIIDAVADGCVGIVKRGYGVHLQ